MARTIRDRARGLWATEQATASLETVLVLPFVFLIIALLLNLGYGSFVRMRTAGATRLGATYYVYLRSTGMEPAPARKVSRDEVQERYFPKLEAIELEPASATGGKVEWQNQGSGFAGGLMSFLAGASSRDRVTATVPRKVPTGTLLPETPARGVLVLDGNTWTCREVSLTMQRLTGLPGELASAATGSSGLGSLFQYGVGSLFWMLGMESQIKDPCE